MKGRKIINRPGKMKTPADHVRMNGMLIAMVVFIGFTISACCPKRLPEEGSTVQPEPDRLSAGPMAKSIVTRTMAGDDEISESVESEIFLIVDAKHRSTGTDPMLRRKLNRKKYVSIRAKGGDAQ